MSPRVFPGFQVPLWDRQSLPCLPGTWNIPSCKRKHAAEVSRWLQTPQALWLILYAFQPLPYPRGFWRSLRHSLVICVLKHVPVGSHYQLNVGAFGRDPYLCHFRSHPHLKHPWMILGSLLSGCQPSLTLSADVWTNLPLAKTPWVLESDLYPFKMSILSLSVPRL